MTREPDQPLAAGDGVAAGGGTDREHRAAFAWHHPHAYALALTHAYLDGWTGDDALDNAYATAAYGQSRVVAYSHGVADLDARAAIEGAIADLNPAVAHPAHPFPAAGEARPSASP